MLNSVNKPRLPKKGQQHIKTLILICVLGLGLLPGLAAALEYRSIGVPKAVLYDTPSSKGKKLFVVSQGYPVEIIVNLGDWLKVRDHYGTLTWVEAKDVNPERTLIVTQVADLHQAPDINSKIVMRVDKDVLLQMLEPPSTGPAGKSWIKVQHRDGLTGFVPALSLWGY